MDGEVWHLVEGRRDDGAPTIFRIRELEPRPDLPRIFVVEMPYPITEMSRLPSAAAYRRLAQFEEQWLIPACAALGFYDDSDPDWGEYATLRELLDQAKAMPALPPMTTGPVAAKPGGKPKAKTKPARAAKKKPAAKKPVAKKPKRRSRSPQR